MTQQSRRGFLTYLGLAGATAATSAAAAVTSAPADEVKELPGPFKNPAQYLAAMHSIGWSALAMYQRLPNSGVHCMGVKETAPEEQIRETWGKFHAIQMRCPIQRASDLPAGDWWKEVWQFLYDHGHREDVTPARFAAKLDGGEL